MFSANENIILRQAKKRVVGYVEECIPDEVLDLGVNVMVMQVSCTAPGCVPVETAVIIVFPSSPTELLPGLRESAGGSYKTKILMPLNEVTKQDVLEALPPPFPGGLRTMEKLYLSARDVMLAKVAQLFGDENDEPSAESRRLMALYLQASLQEYMDRGCVAPEWGEPFPVMAESTSPQDGSVDAGAQQSTSDVAGGSVDPKRTEGDTTLRSSGPSAAGDATGILKGNISGSLISTGNVVMRRPLDDEDGNESASPIPLGTSTARYGGSGSRRVSTVNTRTALRQQQSASRQISSAVVAADSTSSVLLSRLVQREQHARGIRQAGCPCCDPDNPSNVVDQIMLL
jgi:hypothetical protein